MKQINQYGGSMETLASQGLANTGYSESSKIAMYNTYQNRVSTAKSALTKANTEYDNQISQALLNNNVALAEIALNKLQQSYQIALSGFEYKNTMLNNKLNYEQGINDSYFSKNTTLQNQIDNYKSQIAGINQYKDNLEEERRQFNANMSAQKNYYNNMTNFEDTNAISENQNYTNNPNNTKSNEKEPSAYAKNLLKELSESVPKGIQKNGITMLFYRQVNKARIEKAYDQGLLTDDEFREIANYIEHV